MGTTSIPSQVDAEDKLFYIEISVAEEFGIRIFADV